MNNDCGKRAIIAALRWCRFSEKKIAELELDSITYSDDLKQIAEILGLKFINQGIVPASNNPVVVTYRANFEGASSEWHTVFISDIAPMSHWEVHSLITGWEQLLESNNA